MTMAACFPVIPSTDLERSLRLWVQGLGFTADTEMRDVSGRLTFCMLHQDQLHFMLNQRAGSPERPEHYEGIRLYWAPTDLVATRNHLAALGYRVSSLQQREYGQTEFFLTDDDGFSHCFGAAATQ